MMRDFWLKERIAVARRDGARLGEVTVDDVTFGYDPVFFVKGVYAGYLHQIPGTPEYNDMIGRGFSPNEF